MLSVAAQPAAADTAEPAAPAETSVIAPPVVVANATERGVPMLLLKRDTPIHFMVISEVTTKTHMAGHRFRLRVDKPVLVDGITVLPVGAIAWGEVMQAKSSGNVGKSGSLEARLVYVENNGFRIPVTGNNSAKGASGGGETALGILALGPLGLFAKGNNAKIKAGELMTGFVEQDTEIPRPLPTAP
ncbi:hypothetical protein CDQ91_11915 [Sphingopyxis witflariensis]|uniref:Uncharacterized protein n=1 Tax=Sphingopyxis witflariensis TaxID=173675 RepID=A0A246JT81_9SPHN|nr:hypothetical protein CDQ91_11915 [Sphingopyxis witflariensis]